MVLTNVIDDFMIDMLVVVRNQVSESCDLIPFDLNITNKDRLCEERTTILSIGWTSPACEQGLYI